MSVMKVIMHNSVSLDGSFTNFEVDMGVHYQIANRYKADVHLIGSYTIKMGIELYNTEIIPENKEDFTKPSRSNFLPYWVIVDTKGITKGLLHMCRSFEFCRDVILLVSKRTSRDFINYLVERNYDYLVCGDEHIDYEAAFNSLNVKYGVNIILVDSGPRLNEVLLTRHLIDEISLLVHPILVNKKSDKLLANINKGGENINLKLLTFESIESKLVLLRYEVLK